MRLVVGRIGRARGIRGEVSVVVRTDEPELRFAVGARLDTDPQPAGPLTVETVRAHGGRLVVRFAEAADRTAAEALRGVLLVADSTTSPALRDPEDFWDHDLVGLAVTGVDGSLLGAVAEVLHPPGGDLLLVRRPAGAALLVPFVAAIVPHVDLSAGRIVVDPPEGLLEL